MKQEILRLWALNRPKLIAEMDEKFARGDVYILYDVQVYTNNLLRYACQTGDDSLLDSICGLYLLAIPKLTHDGQGMRWVFTDPSSDEFTSLMNQEIPLITSQFLFAAAEAMHGVAGLPQARRTPGMLEFYRAFLPVLTDFYRRNFERFTAKMDKALHMKYPPGDVEFDWATPIYDDYLFFLGGMAYLLAARKIAPELPHVTDGQAASYDAFLRLGRDLIVCRLTERELTDLAGGKATGVNLDLGVWDNFEDYDYSGYDGEAYPEESDKCRARDVGWDISHARRFVYCFDALYDCREATGLGFPDEHMMQGLANQLVYGTFNRDFEKPLFSNFMDGCNGWYRVGYAGRKGFGYTPWWLSVSLPTGGYGFWRRFNGDISRVLESVRAVLEAALADKAAGLETDRTEFARRYYSMLAEPDTLGWLMFLPSVAADGE